MRAFVTGTAGFIGFHLAQRLLADGHTVVGYDGVTDYYDPRLKERRLELLRRHAGFTEVRGMLEDRDLLVGSVLRADPEVIVHLAAQAGVRYSLENPASYVGANLEGTFNLLEAARMARPGHLMIASTSSVYGGNMRVPYRETDIADWPLSTYAATKKAGEAMSHAYAHLHDLPTTCFRFFTVYGPWGRPDMALFRFVAAIEKGEPIEIYGDGSMKRDFTYVGDIVEAIVRLVDTPPVADKPAEVRQGTDSLSPVAPWRTVNIAGGQPVGLLDFIAAVEAATGRAAERRHVPPHPGDLVQTHAAPDLLQALTGYVPATPLAEGVRHFVEWYRAYTA